MLSARRAGVAAALALAMLGVACHKRSAAAPAPSEAGPAEQATALYDDGRYEEARAILESLDAQGKLTGPLIYRLGFCYGSAGDLKKQAEMMQRALDALEKETASSSGLEATFFLANAQFNLRQEAEGRKTAAGATARVEGGQWPRPARALDKFRLGKLYADQGKNDEASRWYRSALEAFAAEGARAPGYVRWARKYLADDAFGRADFAAAERDYAALAALGEARSDVYHRLAVSRVRLGLWRGAGEAWREEEKLNPAQGDQPRYCRHAAQLAEPLTTLPASAPSGSAWSGLTKEDLETLMLEQAKTVRAVQQEAISDPSPDPLARKALEERMVGARSIFVAAALEYCARDYGFQETAFTGGYAPLIFRPGDWELPSPKP